MEWFTYVPCWIFYSSSIPKTDLHLHGMKYPSPETYLIRFFTTVVFLKLIYKHVHRMEYLGNKTYLIRFFIPVVTATRLRVANLHPAGWQRILL